MRENVESIRSDLSVKVCAKALDIIANKWTVLVVYTLEGGNLRYGEMKRRIDGISQKMLTQTLRLLERDGLVRRVVTLSVPPAVDYSLTPLGVTLVGHLQPLKKWANTVFPIIESARENYDRNTGVTTINSEDDEGKDSNTKSESPFVV
ncbi:winged helix-turn-helix transcriptional regulator [Paenibacillus humicola]|uniref:winged helix-turn-helix transcriptional regulator n=1 Tax=Paenibacillus humicola TaxID=3110540 RepID=UPI00237BFF32|nr:helix-turn-helix domain-containing protein [Paenibacillus humicola]